MRAALEEKEEAEAKAKRAQEHERRSRKLEVERLQAEVDALRSSAERAAADAAGGVRALRERLTEAEHGRDAVDMKLAEAEARIVRFEAAALTEAEREEGTKRRLAEGEAREAELRKALHEAGAKIKDGQRSAREAEEERARTAAERQRAADAARQAAAAISERDERVTALVAEVEGWRGRLAAAERARNDAEAEARRREAELEAAARAAAEQARREAAQARARAEALESQLEQAGAAMERLRGGEASSGALRSVSAEPSPSLSRSIKFAGFRSRCTIVRAWR